MYIILSNSTIYISQLQYNTISQYDLGILMTIIQQQHPNRLERLTNCLPSGAKWQLSMKTAHTYAANVDATTSRHTASNRQGTHLFKEELC